MFRSNSNFNLGPKAEKVHKRYRSHFGFEIPEISGNQNSLGEIPPQAINVSKLISYIGVRKEAIIGFQKGSNNQIDTLLKIPGASLESMDRFLILKRVELLMEIPEFYHGMWKQVIRRGKDSEPPLTNSEVLGFISNNGYGPYLLNCMMNHAITVLRNKSHKDASTQVSINAFVSDLLEYQTMENFRSLTNTHGVDIRRIHIEILEDVSSLILKDNEKMSTFVANCKELQKIGYQLSIDDLIPKALSTCINASAIIQNILQQVNPGRIAIKFQGELVRKMILDTKKVLGDDIRYFKEMLTGAPEGTFEQTRSLEEIAKLYSIFGKEFLDKITFQSFHLKRFL